MTSPVELLLILAVVAGLVLFISAPLRRTSQPAEEPAGVAELDTALRAEAIQILRGIDRATIERP